LKYLNYGTGEIKNKIEKNLYIEKFKKGNDKWNNLPCDVWFYILNEFFDDYEQTNYLLRLIKISKLFYNELLSNELIMNNFVFSLKEGVKLSDIVSKFKPSYQIRNLSFIYVKN
jgi:hypothetical protein